MTKNKKLTILHHYLISFLIMIGLTSLTTITILNLTRTYHIIIVQSNLEIVTEITHTRLMHNYRLLIQYLTTPWIQNLYLPDFPMSQIGIIHFREVKNIFHTIQLIAILFIAYLLIKIQRKKQLLSYFNKAANLTFALFGTLLTLIIINFEPTFLVFHAIFFRNDYWILHPENDPIILALPHELFITKAIMISTTLLTISIITKILHHHQLSQSPRTSKKP